MFPHALTLVAVHVARVASFARTGAARPSFPIRSALLAETRVTRIFALPVYTLESGRAFAAAAAATIRTALLPAAIKRRTVADSINAGNPWAAAAAGSAAPVVATLFAVAIRLADV